MKANATTTTKRRLEHLYCTITTTTTMTTIILLILTLTSAMIKPCSGQPSPVTYLTSQNYDEVTKSKTVFVKFFAPWCAYCKRMEKDWDKLWHLWKDSDVGLVAQVDCTDTSKLGGKTLCNRMGIRSFPTLKYGDPNDLEEYDGERTLEDLSAFAEQNLIPICSSERLHLCTDEDQKRTIQKYMDLSMTELEKLIKTEEVKLEEAERKFEMKVEQLSNQFKSAQRDRDTAIEAVMNGDLGLIKSVLKAKEHQRDADHDEKEGREEEEEEDEEETNDEL